MKYSTENTEQPQRKDVHVGIAALETGTRKEGVFMNKRVGEVQSCGIKTSHPERRQTAGAINKGVHGEKKVRKVKARVH